MNATVVGALEDDQSVTGHEERFETRERGPYPPVDLLEPFRIDTLRTDATPTASAAASTIGMNAFMASLSGSGARTVRPGRICRRLAG